MKYIKKIEKKYMNNVLKIMAKDEFCKEWEDTLKIKENKDNYFWVVADFNNDLDIEEDFVFIGGDKKVRKVLSMF